MPITFDTVSSVINDGAATYTLPLTVGTGNNRLMLAYAAEETPDNFRSVVSLTWDGQPFTKINHSQMTGVNEGRIEQWYLLNPNSGASSVQVLWSEIPTTGSGLIVQTYAGVAQQAPEANTTHALVNADPFVTSVVTISTNAWAFGAVMGTSSSTSIISAGTQTQRANMTNAGAFRAASGDQAGTIPSMISFTWDYSSGNDSCGLMSAFAAAAEAPDAFKSTQFYQLLGVGT